MKIFFHNLKSKRIFELLAVSAVLFSCVLNSSSSSATGSSLWHEMDKKEPVKMITPDLYVNIGKKVDDAVVNISTVQTIVATQQPQFQRPGPNQGPFDFWDFFEKFIPKEGLKRQSLGSGFIINADGFIVTNNHVVERADEIKVVLKNDETYEAKVIGRDPKTDIALLKIDAKGVKLKSVPLGNSENMRVGDIVVALGNPFGLDHTLTTGIISAKGRSINLGNYDDFIQTDASINPGNSGGPLLNIYGEVIGINTAINASGQGIGFAIPVNMAKTIIQQLHEKGKVTRGWLGVYIRKVDEDLAKVMGLDKPTGAVVTNVQKDSPAEKAKLQKGDIILTFEGKKVDEFNDLPRMVAEVAPGEKVALEILRDKKKIKRIVTLGELPDEEAVAEKSEPAKKDRLGIEVQTLTRELARNLGLGDDETGVVVTSVDPTSQAAGKGLRSGDLIQEINKQNIKSVDDYKKTTENLKSGDSVLIWYSRGGQTSYIAFTIEDK